MNPPRGVGRGRWALAVLLAVLAVLAVPTAVAQQALDADAAGDVRPDPRSAALDEPAIDLLEARVQVQGNDLVLGLRVSGRPAFDGEPTQREATYLWVVAFDPPEGTRAFVQQDAVVTCSGPEGGRPECSAAKGPFGDGDVDAGIVDDTLTVVLPVDGSWQRLAVGAAANLRDNGSIVAQDFTPGADPFGPRPAPTTRSDDAPAPWLVPVLALAAWLAPGRHRRPHDP